LYTEFVDHDKKVNLALPSRIDQDGRDNVVTIKMIPTVLDRE